MLTRTVHNEASSDLALSLPKAQGKSKVGKCRNKTDIISLVISQFICSDQSIFCSDGRALMEFDDFLQRINSWFLITPFIGTKTKDGIKLLILKNFGNFKRLRKSDVKGFIYGLNLEFALHQISY